MSALLDVSDGSACCTLMVVKLEDLVIKIIIDKTSKRKCCQAQKWLEVPANFMCPRRANYNEPKQSRDLKLCSFEAAQLNHCSLTYNTLKKLLGQTNPPMFLYKSVDNHAGYMTYLT